MNELSPLRYPGGKSRVARYIRKLFEINELNDGHYVEPYAGGAGVALYLLFSEVALIVHINDIDASIYAFWDAVLNNTSALCRRIAEVPLTVEEWKRQRQIQFLCDIEPLDLAVSTFYLNRTNRSGIIRNGGIIGGVEQTGAWKMDARFNRPDLIKRIERIAKYRSRIRLTRMDALHLLKQTETTLPERTLFYLDPPYYVKGKGLYANYYRHSDHEDVAKQMGEMKLSWVVSYDSVPEIHALYNQFGFVEYRLRYTARERYDGKEVMFFSRNLRLPDAKSA